ncbi:glycoside hydrolase family 9 protein [Ruminococcus flavefaciens]|uniref:Dockerin domain-containing protein n=1 Tax=Ruminococcus flavefaciens 007c TaxID=1341157 RepID=W7UUA9_RUMFL|nr:glycoside hydrolase family 9 protein [Ruminococcus flavefaciens]EWM52415.1 hypothetical protein RF007C_13780 [Ruminococcus flavefaciens 007c]
MKKQTSKHLLKKMMALSIAAVSTAAFAPFTAEADCLGQHDFNEGIALPWTVFQKSPAEQRFDIKGGSLNITIVNPGGEKRGGDSRWDLGILHRNIHIEKDHKYKIHWEVNASADGELHTDINAIVSSQISTGEGVWQNNSEKWDRGWDNVKIKKGNNEFDSEFTADRTIENAAWVFQYGGAGPYQYNDCFPEGTVLKFDNIRLECETCGEEFKSSKSTPCLWDPSNEMGKITPRSDVRVNQVGYYIQSNKKATYATGQELKSPVKFSVMKDGEKVYSGTGKNIGFDKEAGEYCQILEFNEIATPGTYTIEVDDPENVYTNPFNGEEYKKYISHEFKIADDPYEGILKDAMNYFYQNRSGEDITIDKITSFNHKDPKGMAGLHHAALHKSDTAYIQSQWLRSYGNEFDGDKNDSIDVSGGWYTGSDYTKNVISGANSVWLLQNMYERSKNINDKADEDALKEARYELEWMFKMIVDSEKDSVWGNDYAGFVYHQVNDHKHIALEASPFIYETEYRATRIVRPPTYAATFNMIACAAQASRLWKGIDDDFAAECLENAEKSWKAVMAYKEKWAVDGGRYQKDPQFAPNGLYVGSAAYDDSYVQDEAYWAACELFATTGAEEYYNELKTYSNSNNESDTGNAFNIELLAGYDGFTFSTFNNSNTATLGTLSLSLSDKVSAKDKTTITNNILKTADIFCERENASDNGMGLPYKLREFQEEISMPGPSEPDGYEFGSNAYVANNAMIIAYAYDLSNYDMKYFNGAVQAMDYLFGRNGLGISYITGYGTYHSENPTHWYWKDEIDNSYPMAPSGIMVSGPYSALYDDYIKSLGMEAGKVASQKCYADSVYSWSTNDTAADIQASFVWNLAFIDNGPKFHPVPPPTTTTTSTTTTTTTTTTTSEIPPSPKKYGDSNCDGTVDLADAILIMQALANPDKYGENGSDKNHLTESGKELADVDRGTVGLTGDDAVRIQEYLLKKVSSLSPDGQ